MSFNDIYLGPSPFQLKDANAAEQQSENTHARGDLAGATRSEKRISDKVSGRELECCLQTFKSPNNIEPSNVYVLILICSCPYDTVAKSLSLREAVPTI